MARKKRGSAKTGDRALYKSRPSSTGVQQKTEDDDSMYNEVDRFHKNREEEEYLRFNKEEEEPEDEIVSGREGVMDLGVTVDDDDSSSSDDDDESTSSRGSNSKGEGSIQEEEMSSSSDSEVEQEEEDVLDWGRSKSAYYHGDTADLEIGQEEEDALVEEEAAKQVLKSRYEDMDEDDFLLPTKCGNEDAKDSTTIGKKPLDSSSTNRRQMIKAIQSHHPELLPLLKHFSQVVQEYDRETRVVTNALLTDSQDNQDTNEAIGATPMGLRYIVTKAALQASVALNVAAYLLLKTEEEEQNQVSLLEDDGIVADTGSSSITESHPVLARLQDCNKLLTKLQTRVEDKVDTLPEQVTSLVKAAELMREEQGEEVSSQDSSAEILQEANLDFRKEGLDGKVIEEVVPPTAVSSSSDELENVGEEDDHMARDVLNEARFGLRPVEVGATLKENKSRKRASSDFGDDDHNDDAHNKATRALASTINAIEQRSQTRKRRAAPSSTVEKVDYENDEQAMDRGLEMMQAEGLFDSDNDDNIGDQELGDANSDNDDNDFYQSIKKKSKSKKEFKKNLYKVAPKYPSLPEEVEGERAIGRAIFKNRGLVAHKSKLNRNPRVKKREQYRKALIRRKGTVREVRTDEAQKYGGEETGIKSGLSRSRKLGVRY